MPALQAYFRKHKKRLDLQRLVQEHRDMLEQARDAELLAEQQVRMTWWHACPGVWSQGAMTAAILRQLWRCWAQSHCGLRVGRRCGGGGGGGQAQAPGHPGGRAASRQDPLAQARMPSPCTAVRPCLPHMPMHNLMQQNHPVPPPTPLDSAAAATEAALESAEQLIPASMPAEPFTSHQAAVPLDSLPRPPGPQEPQQQQQQEEMQMLEGQLSLPASLAALSMGPGVAAGSFPPDLLGSPELQAVAAAALGMPHPASQVNPKC